MQVEDGPECIKACESFPGRTEASITTQMRL